MTTSDHGSHWSPHLRKINRLEVIEIETYLGNVQQRLGVIYLVGDIQKKVARQSADVHVGEERDV